MKTIKQLPGSGMCAVCVAAMATETTPEDIYRWLNDGREMGDPMTDQEVAAYLLHRGYLMGGHYPIPEEEQCPLSHNTFLHMRLGGIAAYLGVKSWTYAGVEHAVYWDGTAVRDPNPNTPETTPLDLYTPVCVFPIFKWGVGPLRTLQMRKRPLPLFVREYREHGPGEPLKVEVPA